METQISRSEAKRQGLKRYHGRFCNLGHGNLRYTGDTKCVECKRIKAFNYVCKNSQKRKDYHQNNLNGYARRTAQYRASKLQATPKWADTTAIRVIYETCPPDYHVDHIIPLQGKNVCGLHVENNLQHLPALDNLKKSNKVDVNLVSAS